MSQKNQGFTIVELLIVIVVIGILAAITIVAFNGVQNRANDTAVQSDLKSLKQKLDAYKVLNSEQYPDGSSLGSAVSGWRASASAYTTTGDNLVYCYSDTDRTVFALVARSKSGNSYQVSYNAGVQPLAVAWSNASTCGNLTPVYPTNFRGYASTDTTTGPWRSWTGVAN